jgi:hypothetical protein
MPLVIEHRLHRLICPCCSTSTCAPLPADVQASPYGPRLSALVGLLGSDFPLSFSKTQALLDQLLGVQISRGAMVTIRERISATLEQPMQEAIAFARQQPVAYVDCQATSAFGPPATRKLVHLMAGFWGPSRAPWIFGSSVCSVWWWVPGNPGCGRGSSSGLRTGCLWP